MKVNIPGRPDSLMLQIYLIADIDGLKISRYRVLMHLHRRFNDKFGFAWCSNRDIAEHCEISAPTVTACLKELEAQGFITRDLRDGDPTKSRKTVIHWETIATRQRKKLPQEEAPTKTAPDAIDLSNEGIRLADVSRIQDLLREFFPDHSTFAHRGCAGIMMKAILACIQLAGSEEKCYEVIYFVLSTDPERRDGVAKSNKLGGYLTKAFPEWLKEYDESLGDFEMVLADDLYPKGVTLFEKTADYLVEPLTRWLGAKLGSDLVTTQKTTQEDGSILFFARIAGQESIDLEQFPLQ
jgi:DNA-binding MarR family transcriptional regulator